jgi:hypothetical protein
MAELWSGGASGSSGSSPPGEWGWLDDMLTGDLDGCQTASDAKGLEAAVRLQMFLDLGWKRTGAPKRRIAAGGGISVATLQLLSSCSCNTLINGQVTTRPMRTCRGVCSASRVISERYPAGS